MKRVKVKSGAYYILSTRQHCYTSGCCIEHRACAEDYLVRCVALCKFLYDLVCVWNGKRQLYGCNSALDASIGNTNRFVRALGADYRNYTAVLNFVSICSLSISNISGYIYFKI